MSISVGSFVVDSNISLVGNSGSLPYSKKDGFSPVESYALDKVLDTGIGGKGRMYWLSNLPGTHLTHSAPLYYISSHSSSKLLPD